MKWAAVNQVKAETAGGIDTVVKVINSHINNYIVCYAGCGALMSMTVNNSKNNNRISKIIRMDS